MDQLVQEKEEKVRWLRSDSEKKHCSGGRYPLDLEHDGYHLSTRDREIMLQIRPLADPVAGYPGDKHPMQRRSEPPSE
jgi:hypothetical protein